MKIDLITLFPNMIINFINNSILKQAQLKKLIKINLHSLRKWGINPNYKVDDRPFGGGAGMLLKPEPLFTAIEHLKEKDSKIIYMSPDGLLLNSNIAKKLSQNKHLILISGHYEGIDERVRLYAINQEISIGNYILTNGTLSAAVLIDVVARYIPGVLGSADSLTNDSFNNNLVSFPQYTRPQIYKNLTVPKELISGNHKLIENWRKQQSIKRTKQKRPNLLKKEKKDLNE